MNLFSTKFCTIVSPQFICRRNGSTIPVILVDKLEKKGEKGDIIQVKRGYARNFLIPRKIAGTVFESHILFLVISK